MHAVQIAYAPDPDGRPPSIHLSEYAYVEAAAPATAVALAATPPTDPSAPLHPFPSSYSTPSSPMPAPVAARGRRATLDLPRSPYDDLKPAPSPSPSPTLELGTSPKPCIVPGNALHLIDDDPAAPRSATPPSVIIVGDASDADREHDEHEHERTGPRVRFRSRVRITSGLHRHRHAHSHSHSVGGSTPGSTTSESPSSSISAPLRYQADDDAAWGPIGKRLSAYASSGAWPRRMHGHGQGHGQAQVRTPIGGEQTYRQGGGAQGYGTMTRSGMRTARAQGERTPLLRPHLRHTYSESEDEDGPAMREEERALRAAALRREEEAVFGRWPWRIFNRHVSALSSLLLLFGRAERTVVVVVARRTSVMLLLRGR